MNKQNNTLSLKITKYQSATRSSTQLNGNSFQIGFDETLQIHLQDLHPLIIKFNTISQSRSPNNTTLINHVSYKRNIKAITTPLTKVTSRALHFDPNLGGRVQVWETLIQRWSNKPIFGTGNEIKTHYFQTSLGLHDSHSLAMAMLYKGGFTALLLFLLTYTSTIFQPTTRKLLPLMFCIFIFINLDDHLILFKLRPFWLYLILPLYVALSLNLIQKNLNPCNLSHKSVE